MVLKFWARLFVSVAAIGLIHLAPAEGFGRFGYSKIPTIPNWRLEEDGIRPKFQAADLLRFDGGKILKWRPVNVSSSEASYEFVTSGSSPTKMRMNLFAAGPEFLFQQGFKIRSSALQPPLISWNEGSVGPDVESAPSRWAAISYQDSQPPVILCFLEGTPSLIVTGKPGNWLISVAKGEYKRWVRFGLPLGVRALTTTGAASLGAMVTNIRDHLDFWISPSPKLLSVKAINETDAVTGVWTFNIPNAVVPYAAVLAKRAGYNVQVNSEVKVVSSPTDEGPMFYATGKEIRLRFPMLSLPRGRSLTAGTGKWVAPIADPKKPFSIFNAAIASMCAARPADFPEKSGAVLSKYLENVPFIHEPITDAMLPFQPNGSGAGEAAFYSLLQQCLAASNGLNAKPNGLFTSLVWAIDSHSWQLQMIQDPKIRRRTSAVAALAGAMSSDPNMRLNAGILEAGLVAERGLFSWQGIKQPPKLIEPMENLRRRLFKPRDNLPKREPILPMLVNPYRVLIGPPMEAKHVEGGYHVTWIAKKAGKQKIVFQSPVPIELDSVRNIADFVVDDVPDLRTEVEVTVSKPGPVVLQIKPLEGKQFRLPPTPSIVYSEVYQ